MLFRPHGELSSTWLVLLLVMGLMALLPGEAGAYQEPKPGQVITPNMNGQMTFGGEFVHNVGELQMNLTNFGVFGSYPNTGFAMSESPSAQWPAGSGVEYLWSAGIWCGARVSGIARVSTTQFFTWEFRPGIDPIYTIYRSFEGTRGGSRLPSSTVDDDNDDVADEDPLNGFDDDGDGLIDEDYAAISNQMFRCTYRDDLPECFSFSPDHQPLNILIEQESYQWENDRVDDFVGVEFTIHNLGEARLSDFFMGFYADPDIGGRTTPSNFDDDLVAYLDTSDCVPKGNYMIPVRFAMGIAWDADRDVEEDIKATGEIGIMFLGHTTDPSGENAPERITLRSWQKFSGNASFEDEGDPTNDDQSYQLLSARSNDRPPNVPRDYRMLLSAGPFQIASNDSIEFQVAFVVGDERAGLLDNAAQAKLTYDGNWFNLDASVLTGANCNEKRLFDLEQEIEWTDPCDSMAVAIVVPRGEEMWVNDDCEFENLANAECQPGVQEGSEDWWCTGKDGKETQIHWLYGSPPPPPNIRIWPTEGKQVIFWDNFSETVPDISELIYDFEGYRIWRADHWDRPFGSSVENGPASDLWMLLGEYDLANSLGTDTGLEVLSYQPNVDVGLINYYQQVLIDDPDIISSQDHAPPLGYQLADADTAIYLAKAALGLPGGKRYYRYEDTKVHLGMHYFYAVTATDHVPVYNENDELTHFGEGLTGDPSSGFVYSVPQSRSQGSWEYDPDQVYVVPNPATTESMAPWALNPNNDDPTGLKVEFRHLPAARCTIRIYTLAGDMVETVIHDMTSQIANGDYAATGTATWDLVSRNGQDVASGVYIFSVEADGFESKVGKFVLIR
jgi:hypothetical protein